MNNIGKKIVTFSMIGFMQVALGASIIEASPLPDNHYQIQQKYEDRGQDRHERERIENERHKRERIENDRHEREMKRRPHEKKKEWRERQQHENERHERALEDIRHGR